MKQSRFISVLNVEFSTSQGYTHALIFIAIPCEFEVNTLEVVSTPLSNDKNFVTVKKVFICDW